jgi:hypothetical protein
LFFLRICKPVNLFGAMYLWILYSLSPTGLTVFTSLSASYATTFFKIPTIQSKKTHTHSSPWCHKLEDV